MTRLSELIETGNQVRRLYFQSHGSGCQDETHGRKRIPANIDWDDIDSIATEARQKFKLINPETIGPS